MKNVAVLLVLISCFTGSIYSQKWTLDRCLAYAQHNNKKLLANSQNRKIAELDKNQIFPILPYTLIEKLNKKYELLVWKRIDDSNYVVSVEHLISYFQDKD